MSNKPSPHFFAQFKVPKRLQAEDGQGSTRAYSIYKIIGELMYMNQQLPDILELDIIEALSLIQAYNKIMNPPKKKKGLPSRQAPVK